MKTPPTDVEWLRLRGDISATVHSEMEQGNRLLAINDPRQYTPAPRVCAERIRLSRAGLNREIIHV